MISCSSSKSYLNFFSVLLVCFLSCSFISTGPSSSPVYRRPANESVTRFKRQSQLNKSDIKYYLKWIYDDYPLPIWLEQHLDENSKNKQMSWYKYSNKAFIDKLGK